MDRTLGWELWQDKELKQKALPLWSSAGTRWLQRSSSGRGRRCSLRCLSAPTHQPFRRNNISSHCSLSLQNTNHHKISVNSSVGVSSLPFMVYTVHLQPFRNYSEGIVAHGVQCNSVIFKWINFRSAIIQTLKDLFCDLWQPRSVMLLNNQTGINGVTRGNTSRLSSNPLASHSLEADLCFFITM